jgi:quinoprotein glucose dehydrogenase
VGANLFGTSLVALDARTGKRLWHFQMVHHDLWDLDPSAAPQLTTIRHEGRRRDVVAVAGKSGFLYVFDRVTGEPIWPVEERPVPKSTMPGEQSWPTQPYPTNPPPFAQQSFSVDDISPYLPPAEQEALRARLLAANSQGLFTPISLDDTVHVPTSNGGTLFGGTAAEPDSGAVYIVTHDNPGILHLQRPGAGRGGPPVPPGQSVYQQHCQTCHGPGRLGTEGGVPLIHAATDPLIGAVAGASRFDAAAIRAVVTTGKGRMSAFPHVTGAELEALVAYLTAAPGGRGRAGGFGRGGGPVASGAPPELIAGSGSAWTRPPGTGGRGRGGAQPYPEGTPAFDRYTINEYHTVGYGMRPPYTSIVKYDLNEPAIKWRIGYGDDPDLAARGITGTGMPGITNSLVVTESGLVFGAGRDNRIRAWDSGTGRELWSARFGGNFLGSPTMYETDGRQYLLVPAASVPAGRGRGAGPAAAPAGGGAQGVGAPTGPMGWVAYTLPTR